MKMPALVAGTLVSSAMALTVAQTPAPAPRLSFEVASIRPVEGGGPPAPPGAIGAPAGGVVRYPRGSLRTLVMWAFDIWPRRHDPEPVGGPAWADSDLFEVVAKGPGDLTLRDARVMMRSLLEDRFQLRFHVEKRELPIYALTVRREDGRLGEGMRPAAIDCSGYSEILARTGRGALATKENPKCGLTSGGAPAVAASLGMPNSAPRGAQAVRGIATLRELITALTRDPELDRPIVDRTGLSGTYEFTLMWVPSRIGGIVADPSAVLPLGVALQDQLGLKMESRREPRDVIVIDSAEKPALD